MKILESLEPVLEQSKHVSVDIDNVKDYARAFDRTKLRHWLSMSPFEVDQLNEKEKLSFLVVLDSISFSYWGNPKWVVKYKGEECDGTQAMMACLGRAIEEGTHIFNSDYLANIERKDLEHMLRGNVEIPLLEERLRILNEIGIVIEERFRGDFRYIVDKAQGDALQLMRIVVDNFPSFKDSATYRGKRIYFNKRAQLLVSDIDYFFERLNNVDKLTACADYKLPYVLRRCGILQYSDKLRDKIIRKEEICARSEEEIEIRANTIQAVELIKNEIKDLTSNQINDYLWLESQIKLLIDEPYHLTRTTAY